MKTIIYVKLLDEGTKVYRPVSATKLNDNQYQIDEGNIYDTEHELWDFPPGSCVEVVAKYSDEELILVASSLRADRCL